MTYYRPPWYPNRDPEHNPWSIPDNQTGKTHYETWCDSLPPGELLRLVRAHQGTKTARIGAASNPTRR